MAKVTYIPNTFELTHVFCFKDVSEAKSISWLSTLSYSPLLKFSSPFQELKEYYPDGIGFSVLSLHDNKQNGKQSSTELRSLRNRL